MATVSEFQQRAILASRRAKALEFKREWEESGERERDARRAIPQTESARKAFRNFFGEEPEMVFGNFVYHAGVLLLRVSVNVWSLFDHCPICGQEVWSVEFEGLSGLGAQLLHFRPDYNPDFQPHECGLEE